jgi:hypothetical protein
MEEGPTWADLFERADAFETDEPTIRATLDAIREDVRNGQ